MTITGQYGVEIMRVVVILGLSAKKQLFLCARRTGRRKRNMNKEEQIYTYIHVDDACDLNTANDANRMTTTQEVTRGARG